MIGSRNRNSIDVFLLKQFPIVNKLRDVFSVCGLVQNVLVTVTVRDDVFSEALNVILASII